MPFIFRKRFRLGPVFVNVGKAGVTSWGVKLGRLTWNATRRTTSLDLPGPVNYRTRPRRGRRRDESGLSTPHALTLICVALTFLFAALTLVRGRATVVTIVLVALAAVAALLTLVAARRSRRGGAR